MTSQVGGQLGRPDELAVLEAQLSMLAARRGIAGAPSPPHVPPHTQHQPGGLATELFAVGVASLWLERMKWVEVLGGYRLILAVAFSPLCSAFCTPAEVCKLWH